MHKYLETVKYQPVAIRSNPILHLHVIIKVKDEDSVVMKDTVASTSKRKETDREL